MTARSSGDASGSDGADEVNGIDDATPRVRRLAAWDAADLTELAEEYGTPLYVIDLDRVRENCARLLSAFPVADVKYALKAHAGRAVLETVRTAGLGAECASAGEVERALAAGFEGDRVQYTAVNPPAQDLDRVVERWRDHPDLTVVAGARDTVERLRDRGFDGRLAVRANPGVGAGHHEKVTTGGHAKFGVPSDRVPDLVADVAGDVDLVGLHAHAGSGISGDDLDAHRELVRRMGDLARDLEAAGHDLEFVDVGGGFGVPYREDEPPLDLEAVAAATRDALGEVDATLAVEPGRYVVADAGVLLTRVNTVKPMPGTVVAGVDAGMTTLLRPAMYGAYHAIRNLSADGGTTAGAASGADADTDNEADAGVGSSAVGTDADPDPDSRESISVTVAGPICESGDTLCEDRMLPRPRRGDVLAVGTAGAYGYEMASTYNSRPRPAEVAVADGEATLVRRRERLTDLTELEV